jgi:transglutaminase-like putative cysteine protease
VEAYQESERSLSEPWYRLYYDQRALVLAFPTLEPGDVLEVAYRVDDIASDNLLSDYFGDQTPLQSTVRAARVDYVLLMPPGRAIHANAPSIPGLTHEERAVEGGTEHRWSARDVAAIAPEPGMPGFAEVSPPLHVSTYADWRQVADFYWGLVRDQLRPNAEVKAAARRIAGTVPAARAKDELTLIKAVYDYVVTNTRYVGLEFGIHGWKPYRVDQVLERRFGDCKDKASLMHALLEALGIDSRMVLLRMRHLGALPEYPASLSIFNHAILYVPKYDLWLDGTAAYSGSRDLPGEDRGATVLVVNPGAAPRFGRIPEAKPEDNRTTSAFDVTLTPDGAARVRGESVVTGTHAPEYRRAYEAEREQRATFEEAWGRTFPGLKVETVSLSDLSRLEDDVSMRFALSVSRYAIKDGPALAFDPFGTAHGYVESYAPLSRRRFDLVIADPWENLFTYRYELPSGFAVVELPPAATLESPFGSFTIRYQEEAGRVTATGRIAFQVGRVSASEYPAFRAFLEKLDAAMARRVRVAPRANQN